MKTSIRTTLSIAALSAAMAFPLTADALDCTVEDPCVVRLSTVAPRGTPWADQMNRLKDSLEEQSGGRLDVRTYLGASEGEVSLARQCKDGSLEGVGVSTGAIATLVPQLGVFELPFLFDSLDDADDVIDNHLFDPVSELLTTNGFQLYIFSENGFRNFATSNGNPIRTPADFGNIQMRAQESWIHEAMYTALEGNPVTIPVTEVSAALSSGNVQGFDNTPLYAQAAGWQEFVDTWSVSNHIYQPAVVVYNQEWFDSVPADIQEILLSNRAEETRRGRRDIRAINPMLVQNLSAFDIEVVELTSDERATMATITSVVHDEFRSRVDGGSALLDLVLNNL